MPLDPNMGKAIGRAMDDIDARRFETRAIRVLVAFLIGVMAWLALFLTAYMAVAMASGGYVPVMSLVIPGIFAGLAAVCWRLTHG